MLAALACTVLISSYGDDRRHTGSLPVSGWRRSLLSSDNAAAQQTAECAFICVSNTKPPADETCPGNMPRPGAAAAIID